MLVWLGRRTVQNMVKNRATIGSGQYTLLSGRPVQTGRSSSNSNFLRPRVIFVRKVKTRGAARSRTRTSHFAGILLYQCFVYVILIIHFPQKTRPFSVLFSLISICLSNKNISKLQMKNLDM